MCISGQVRSFSFKKRMSKAENITKIEPFCYRNLQSLSHHQNPITLREILPDTKQFLTEICISNKLGTLTEWYVSIRIDTSRADITIFGPKQFFCNKKKAEIYMSWTITYMVRHISDSFELILNEISHNIGNEIHLKMFRWIIQRYTYSLPHQNWDFFW